MALARKRELGLAVSLRTLRCQMDVSMIAKQGSRHRAGARFMLLSAMLVGAVIVGLLVMHTLNLHGTPAARTGDESAIVAGDGQAAAAQHQRETGSGKRAGVPAVEMHAGAATANSHDGAARHFDAACDECGDSHAGMAMACIFLLLFGFVLLIPRQLRTWLWAPMRAGPIIRSVLSAPSRAPSLEVLCISRK